MRISKDYSVEDYLQNERHIANRMDSFKGYKYRYINELMNDNISKSEGMFKQADDHQQVIASKKKLELEMAPKKLIPELKTLVGTVYEN